MGKNNRGGRRGLSSLKATPEQKKRIKKIQGTFKVGNRGIGKFGGENSTITEPAKFERGENGNIRYIVVGESYFPPIKSAVIGVGDMPALLRKTVSTGLIAPNGKTFLHERTVTEKRTQKR